MAHERRILKMQSRIKRDIADIFQREVKDPRMKGLLTITRVKVARDLGHARIYYTILGTPGQRSAAEKFIASAQPYIQRAVVSGLKIRIAPKIEFTYDESVEMQASVSKLIDEAIASDARPKPSAEGGLKRKKAAGKKAADAAKPASRKRKRVDEEE
ncbi:MAG: 30S ribosome-binding factor RbfA [Planctomycetes bacterium]|nr:30S ribosome-binding factor RbfA [Planctomycetota bacterium]